MADGSAIKTTSSGKKYTEKDPNDILDYPFQYTDWLADIADSYLSHVFVITNPAGASTPIEIVSSSESNGVVTPFVKGGTLNKTHQITCRVTTVGGRVKDQSLDFKIKQH